MHRTFVSGFFLSLLAASSCAAGSEPSPTLAELAPQWVEGLGQGAVATAEKVDGKWSFSLAGEAFEGNKNSAVPGEKVIFEIGSISKVFTGILLAQAVQEGKLALEDPLAKRLPIPSPGTYQDPAVGAVTLKQLATHTSCLPRLPTNMKTAYASDPYATYGDKALFAYLEQATLAGEPPCEAAYSNLGFSILGVVLERALHKPWGDLVTERIAQPLGMVDTAQVLSEEQEERFAQGWSGTAKAVPWTFQSVAGAGALRSTLADMSRFADALAAGASGPLKEVWPLIAGDYAAVAPVQSQIGLALLHSQQDGVDSYWHNGGTGGFRSVVQVYPALGEAAVILASNAFGTPEAWLAEHRKMDRKETATEASLPTETSLPKELLADYEGVFEIDSSARFTLIQKPEGLVARLTGQPFAPIFASAKDEFFYKVVDAQLSFHRGESGKVESLTLHQNGRDLPAKKTGPAPTILFPSTKELEAYVGEYDFGQFQPGATITVTAPAGMIIQLTGQPPVPAFCVGENRFELDVVEATLVFERGESGEVEAVVLHQNGLQMRSPRTTGKEP
ncbi:MAG: serine hydrolase [Deltaproteobacteria bacterium]|nr:serine hydrolase [Deltaproteobacteria bacterium]